jgi:hypothetical protein
MLLGSRERYLIRHEIGFKPQRDKGAGLDLISEESEDVIGVIRDAIENGTALMEIKDDDVVKLTKVDVNKRTGLVTLLFRRSDPDGSVPVFENRQDDTLRSADKADHEAEAVSAHLFIRIVKVPGQHPTYRAALEEVPGLGRTYVQQLLKSILREAKYEYEDHRGETGETYSVVTFGGIPSETVGTAMRGGGMNYVELVRPPRLDGLDTHGMLPREERLRISIKPADRRNMDLIGRLRDWAAQNEWQKVRVQVKSGERTKVVDVAREADAADVLFVKSELVKVRTSMKSCTDTINKELSAVARNLLYTDDGWS